MSQYYPQQGPYFPPTRGPEEYDDYEYDEEYVDEQEASSLVQRMLLFSSGGCLVFVCIGCCILSLAGLWILDPGGGLASTPPAESELGLTFDDPAFQDEAVVNEENVQLRVLEVNRNVALPNYAPVEGRELVVITIELINLGSEEISYNEGDFILINQFEEAYTVSPAASAVDGALGRGKLRPNEGIEGRLVFDVLAGEVNLILGWEGGRNVQARYIFIE